MTSADKAAITRERSLAAGGALQHRYAELMRDRRSQERDRRRADRATVGRRVCDLGRAILRTNK